MRLRSFREASKWLLLLLRAINRLVFVSITTTTNIRSIYCSHISISGVGREIKFELVKKIIILSKKTLTRLTVITETRKPSIVIEEGIHTKHRTERERESHMKIHRRERERQRERDTKMERHRELWKLPIENTETGKS